MTATRIPDAFIVTCGDGCPAPHGWHMVMRIGGRWFCDGSCPAYTHDGTCGHITEAIETSAEPRRLEVIK